MVRQLSLTMVTIVTIAAVTSTVLVMGRLLHSSVAACRAMIYSALAVWLTITNFGIWFS